MENDQFAQAVRPHVEAMVGLAAILVGSADAEDAAQEALVRAWRGWSSLHDVAAARPWLLRITVNVCHNWRRGHFGTQQRLTTTLDPSLAAAFSQEPGTSDHADTLDLYSGLASLNDELRTTVLLRYFAGLDATEIGAIMGVPAGRVRTRLRRALQRLHHHLTLAAPSSPSERGS